MNAPDVVFWPNSETTCWIQSSSRAHQKAIERLPDTRLVGKGVKGTPLRIHEIQRTLPWVRREVPKAIPGATEVWGGDWSDFYAKVADLKDSE